LAPRRHVFACNILVKILIKNGKISGR